MPFWLGQVRPRGKWLILRHSSRTIPVRVSSQNWCPILSTPITHWFSCLSTSSLCLSMYSSIHFDTFSYPEALPPPDLPAWSDPLLPSSLIQASALSFNPLQNVCAFNSSNTSSSFQLQDLCSAWTPAWSYLATMCVCLTDIHLSDCSLNPISSENQPDLQFNTFSILIITSAFFHSIHHDLQIIYLFAYICKVCFPARF